MRAETVAEPLDAIRTQHRLPSDPTLAMPARHLVVSPFPPSFRDPAFPLPGNAISIRPDAGRASAGIAPAWLSQPFEAPIVYFTLGTIFNQESGDLFARVLSGLRELPATVVVTVGRNIDPERFGPQLSALLRDGHTHEAAERIRDEIASLPGPDAVVPLVERLVEGSLSSPSA